MKSVLQIPLAKRILFCFLFSIFSGSIVGMSMPESLVNDVPMVPMAAMINLLLIGGLIAISGLETWSYTFHRRVHPVFRGAAIAATIHLDFIVYIWPDQTAFWQAILYAAVYGALLDVFATQLFGQGKSLMKGLSLK